MCWSWYQLNARCLHDAETVLTHAVACSSKILPRTVGAWVPVGWLEGLFQAHMGGPVVMHLSWIEPANGVVGTPSERLSSRLIRSEGANAPTRRLTRITSFCASEVVPVIDIS